MIKNALSLILILFLVTKISAYDKWSVVGVGGGGNIVDVVCHPTDPGIVWVVTDLTGIFKSTDGGKNFKRMSGQIERNEELFEWMRCIDHELVYDLSNPDIMYWAMDGGIYTEPGLYKSEDGGESWFKIPGSPDLSPGAIVVDYNGVIYGIKHKKMYVSLDKGKTWITKPDVPTYYCGEDYSWRRRYRIIIYTTADNKIIIGDRREGSGIFYTTDMGETWTNVLKGKEIMDIATSPSTPGLVAAFEQDGRIFRSEDGCKNFEMIEKLSNSYYEWGTWPAFYGSISINKNNDIMAIGRNELGISLNSGKTFKLYEQEDCNWDPGDYIFPNRIDKNTLFKCNKLTASPADGRWYFVEGMLVKRSDDNGASWLGTSNGIDILCIYSPPVIDVVNPDIIHLGAGDVGHFFTKDLGKKWESSEENMVSVEAIAQDPNDAKILYKMYGRQRDHYKILKSIDGGYNWVRMGNINLKGRFKYNYKSKEQDSTFYNSWCGRIVVDPANSNRVFASHRGSDGLYLSEDGGENFDKIYDKEHIWQLEVTKNGAIYFCTWDAKGLFRSTDNGNNFVNINNSMVHDFAVHPDNDEIIYANIGSFSNAWASARVKTAYELNRNYPNNGKGKLYKTTNGGKNWELLGAYDGFAIYIEPNYPNVMLMSTREGGNGIMKSMDAGKTWKSIHNNHNNYHPRGFVYGGVPGRVYSWNHNMERIDDIHIEEYHKCNTNYDIIE